MNSDALDQLWNSAANRPEPSAGQRLASHFIVTLRRRRRFQAFWLGWTALLLTSATVLAASHLVRKGFHGMTGEWAMFLLLAMPWMALVYFLRAFLRHGAVRTESALPLRTALLAAQAANAVERRHLRLVSALFAAMLPVTALAIGQLQAAGKTPGQQAWSMSVAFGVIFLVGALGLLARYRRRLSEQRLIEARLRELERA